MKVIIDKKFESDDTVKRLQATVSETLSDIDMSKYGVNELTCILKVDCDSKSYPNAIPLNEIAFIIFKNQPRQYVYDYSFEALLSKIRLRLQRVSITEFVERNLIYEFDFSYNSTTNSSDINNEMKKDEEARQSLFAPQTPEYQMHHLFLNDDLKSEINNALSVVTCREKIYSQWGFSNVDPHARAILSFYGPAGTGKTMCAHAIASELNKQIICVNYADIESKWAGESPKNLIAAFKSAKDNNAVIFFDEADSFLGKRIGNVQSGHDQSINSLRSQMLILLEEFDGVVIFATNLVTNYDKAFETRILKHLKFDLPNEEARMNIFKGKIANTTIPTNKPFVDEDYSEMAKASEGFSGRDIRNSVFDTLLNGAKNGVENFSVLMFVEAINRRQEAYKKLREEEDTKKKEKEQKIASAILNHAEKEYRTALVNIAIHAAWSDSIMAPSEEAIIKETAKMFGIETPNLDSVVKIPTLNAVCERFNDLNSKKQAIDMACKVVAIDGVIQSEELDFLNRLIIILGFNSDLLQKVRKYIELIIQANIGLDKLLDPYD